MQKVERGVMVMKDGMVWGLTCNDPVRLGWTKDPKDALLFKPGVCKVPIDAMKGRWYKSAHLDELSTATVVTVERVTTVTILGGSNI